MQRKLAIKVLNDHIMNGRAFVTTDKFDAETYARKTADLKNKGFLEK